MNNEKNETIKSILDELYTERFLYSLFITERGLEPELAEWKNEMKLKYNLIDKAEAENE